MRQRTNTISASQIDRFGREREWNTSAQHSAFTSAQCGPKLYCVGAKSVEIGVKIGSNGAKMVLLWVFIYIIAI